MLNFFYASLETLKQVKKPTKKDIITVTIQIFVVIILAWVFFAITDWVFASLYQRFYNLMK